MAGVLLDCIRPDYQMTVRFSRLPLSMLALSPTDAENWTRDKVQRKSRGRSPISQVIWNQPENLTNSPRTKGLHGEKKIRVFVFL